MQKVPDDNPDIRYLIPDNPRKTSIPPPTATAATTATTTTTTNDLTTDTSTAPQPQGELVENREERIENRE